jgi:hypothetical protein
MPGRKRAGCMRVTQSSSPALTWYRLVLSSRKFVANFLSRAREAARSAAAARASLALASSPKGWERRKSSGCSRR